jgi:enterochelin esterase family protein
MQRSTLNTQRSTLKLSSFVSRSAELRRSLRGLRGLFVLILILSARFAFAVGEDAFYHLGPDSMEQPGVPHGKLIGPTTLPSNVYPGNYHTYWIYVPAQYDASKPTALMIFNDGQAFINPKGDLRVPNVLDNLIHRRELPVMITAFINPGHTPQQPEPPAPTGDWGDRTTLRPEEYNTPDPYDKYTRVIMDELMPVVKQQYNISDDPDQHGIAGASSGGIAAFTVAWERPDYFRKVITIVGSFTNIKGGYIYPEKVLASEKKPIRIFMQDGRNDNRALRGNVYDPTRDWFYQNTRLEAALEKKGYEVNYAWGIGLHGQKMGGAILPEMMRWLWRDHAMSNDAHDMVERAFNKGATTEPAGK